MLKSIFKNPLILLSCLMLFISVNARASLITCNTIAECEFLRDQVNARIAELQRSPSVFVYTDTGNSLSWTSALPGPRYKNGCLDVNGHDDATKCTYDVGVDGTHQVRVEDSAAAKACRDLRDSAGNLVGARLPTKAEYESLIRNMGQEGVDFINGVYGPYLTVTGQARMVEIFRDTPDWFWTSTVLPVYSENAVAFSRRHVVYALYRGSGVGVRCVLGR